jgi:hypothetical protein
LKYLHYQLAEKGSGASKPGWAIVGLRSSLQGDPRSQIRWGERHDQASFLTHQFHVPDISLAPVGIPRFFASEENFHARPAWIKRPTDSAANLAGLTGD